MAPDLARNAPMSMPTSPSLPTVTGSSYSWSSRISFAELMRPPRAFAALQSYRPECRAATSPSPRCGMSGGPATSDAARAAPQLLVQLQLQPHRQVVAEDPLGERRRLELAGHR